MPKIAPLARGFWIALTGLCASVPPLMAADVTVSNQLEGYYDNKLRESVLDDRLDTLVRQGPFTLGAALISHSPPPDFSTLDPNNLGPQVQGIRKRWIEAETGDYSVRLGSVYSTFGRGLALQIFEDQTVDFDNVLDGVAGKADFRGWRAQVIGGTNAYGPKALILKGAALGFDLPAGFKTGVTGVWSDYISEGVNSRTGGDRLYGGLLGGGLFGHADVYGEYVLRDQITPLGRRSRGPQGHAGYSSLSLDLGRVQLLGEVKELLRYDLPKIAKWKDDQLPQSFINPPTAVHQHQTTLMGRGSHAAFIDPHDERGVLAESYITLREKTHATLSYSRSQAKYWSGSTIGGNPTKFPTWETYADLEHWLGDRTELIVRLAEAEETRLDGPPTFFERITGGASLLLPLAEDWSVYTTWESQETQQSNKGLTPETFQYADYKDHVVGLTLSKAPSLSWALTTEWTTKKEGESRDFWLWGEWGTRIGERHQLTLGFGRLRGGQVCSGGVCRIVSPFEGGRLELVTNF